jgi:hypothetical protein
MNYNFFKTVLFLLIVSIIVPSCEDPITPEPVDTTIKNRTSSYKSTITSEWILLYCDIEKDLPGFRPATTARALAYIWMSAYEAGLPGMPGFISNSGKLNFPIPQVQKDVNQYNWEIAVNSALAASLKHFMHNANNQQKALIDNLESSLLSTISKGVSADVVTNSVEWGKQIAQAVIDYSQTDVEAEKQLLDPFAKDYTPPTGTGFWQGGKGSALFPYWGKVRTFTTFGPQLISPEPPAYSTNPQSTYFKDFAEVNDNIINMDNEKRWRAEFWSDDIVGMTFSPPARIFQIGRQMLEQENANLETALHLLLKLGLAENDAAVAAWGSKYKYNVERPIHFVRQHINPNFKTILGRAIGTEDITPPFPGYPSGHSTFAGIGISVLAAFFGENYTFTDRCHQGRTEFAGNPRTYTTQSQIGEENAYSRIPLGVHPRFDCVEGLRLGRLIGVNSVNYKLTKY